MNSATVMKNEDPSRKTVAQAGAFPRTRSTQHTPQKSMERIGSQRIHPAHFISSIAWAIVNAWSASCPRVRKLNVEAS